MNFKTLVPAAALLFAGALPVAANAQQQTWVQCAIQSTDAPGVIITVGTTENQPQVRVAGAVCSDMIASGKATPADKYGSWRYMGFNPYCTVHVTPADQFDVYSQSDGDSLAFAQGFCGSGPDHGLIVDYY